MKREMGGGTNGRMTDRTNRMKEWLNVYTESYPSTHQEGEGNVVDSSSLHEEGETAVLPHTHTPQRLILPITGAHPLLSELTPEGLEDL